MKRLPRCILALAAISLLAGANVAYSDSYTFFFTSFDYPGATYTEALGINDSGQIVGRYTVGDGSNFQGFIKNGTTYTSFNYPVLGINNSGQIVGSSFVKDGATSTSIYYPSSDATYVKGINNSGQIVGFYETHNQGASHLHGFLTDGVTYVSFDWPGMNNTYGIGINDSGQIVGNIYSGAQFGFIKNGTSYTSIYYPGSNNTYAYGINNSGQIVGSYLGFGHSTPEGAWGADLHGYLKVGDDIITLDYPGAMAYTGFYRTTAYDINDLGEIVGSYADSNGYHGFIATFVTTPSPPSPPIQPGPPVPLPSAMLLFGSGLLGLVGWRRLKKS
jgi:hypothetical protein